MHYEEYYKISITDMRDVLYILPENNLSQEDIESIEEKVLELR